MSDDTLTAAADAIADFKKQFETSDGKLLGEDAPAAAGK
jgi:F-type H+-transporting ATPase subunit alpha